MSDFRILSDSDHIKLKPYMLAGKCELSEIDGFYYEDGIVNYKNTKIVPALGKIINEILDNSVDEFIRTNGKFSTKIEVSMKLTFDGLEVKVVDNGRGLKIEKDIERDEYIAVLSFTHARAGTSFDETSMSIGSHGYGSMITHTLSSEFSVETHDGNNKLVYKKPNYVKVEPSKKHGTTVTFVPDLTYFNIELTKENFMNHCEFMKQRLINLSICYPKINFTFNGENVSIKDISVFANGISSDHIIHKSEKYSLIISSTAEYQEFRFHNYTNGLWNINGGSLVDYVVSQLCNELVPLIKKKHKIDVTNGQIKNNLFIGIFASNFVNLKFDSQTKERVTNSAKEVAEYFNYDFSILAKKIIQSEAIIDPIVKAILFKKAQAENLELARQQKRMKNEKVLNHIPATYSNANDCSIFIVEGLCLKDDTEILILENNKILSRKIKDTSIGDLVLTHKHRFKEIVSKTYVIKKTVKIKFGNEILEVSPEHRFPLYDTSIGEVVLIEAININPSIHKFLKNKIIYSVGFINVTRVELLENGIRLYTESSDYVFSKIHEVIYWDYDTLSIKHKKAENIIDGDYLLL